MGGTAKDRLKSNPASAWLAVTLRKKSMIDLEDEKKIQEFSKAPRVTLDAAAKAVKHVEYVEHVLEGGGLLRWAVLTMDNGFAVTGRPSAAVSAANDNKAMGEKVAFDNAFNDVWPLLGYELKTKLSLLGQAGAPTGKICGFLTTPKTYIGTKVVHAIEMTRAAYNILRGWQIPDNEDGNDTGYLVQYTDGGLPNVEGFSGYISWSPQNVFEKSYTVGVTKPATTHLDRMKAEREKLAKDIHALGEFISHNPAFLSLAHEEQQDMVHQRAGMKDYLWFLDKRLDRASKK